MGDSYIYKNQKKLRWGYTTGTCAAAASLAAAVMLLQGRRMEQVSLTTPKGIRLDLEVEEMDPGENSVSCGVRKDAGADPDVTDGLWCIHRSGCRMRTAAMLAVPVGIMCMKKTDYGCIYPEVWEWEG